MGGKKHSCDAIAVTVTRVAAHLQELSTGLALQDWTPCTRAEH
jgi:hypothetical protein